MSDRAPGRRRANGLVAAAAVLVAFVATVAAPAAAIATEHEPTAPTTTIPFEDQSSDDGTGPALMERVVPGADPGPFPTSHYDIGYDQGAFNHVARKVTGFLTEAAFALGRWLVRVGIWIVEWAFSFGFADRLAAPAERLARAYQTSVVDRLGLEVLFLGLAGAWAGWQVFRGRVTKGAGEFLASSAIAAVALTVLARPAETIFASLEHVGAVSAEVAAITTTPAGQTPVPPAGCAGGAVRSGGTQDCPSVLRPLVATLHEAFVERPHQLLNWGRLIAADDPCRARYEHFVATGPWGTSDEPRHAMRGDRVFEPPEFRALPLCPDGAELAAFNADPSMDRLGGAVLLTIGAGLLVVLLVAVAAGLVAAQFGVVAMVVVSPFALVAGIVPGHGRLLLWRWVAAIGRALATVAMTTVFLALALVTTVALLDATATEALLVQMAAIDFAVVAGFVARRRLTTAGRRAVTNVVRRIETARVGGSGSPGALAPAVTTAATGFGASQLWAESQGELAKITGPLRRPLRRGAAALAPRTALAAQHAMRARAAGPARSPGPTASGGRR